MTTAPFGSWTSPITAASLVASGHPVSGGRYVGDDIWWLEARPTESGRLAVRRRDASGDVVDVLPAPWNARTRVHEYGGGAWAVTDAGALVFAEFSDQRLYRLDPQTAEPVPLTPAGQGMRFAELSIRGDEVIAVRETHADGDLERDIVAVALDGSGIRSLVGGSRFLAYPRISPDGKWIAWIAWDHPNMPWERTELRVGPIVDGVVTGWKALMGAGGDESVLQPEWADSATVHAISDRSGWWNLYRITRDGAIERLDASDADTGGALWALGTRWHLALGDGRLLYTRTVGTDSVRVLEPRSGDTRDLVLPLTTIGLCDVNGDRVLLTGGSATIAGGLRELNVSTGELTNIRFSTDELPDAAYLPEAEAMTFTGEREVHAIVYRPRNPDFQAPPGELPPFVAVVHGGPTGHSAPQLSLTYAFFASRGIGVIDINYGGSTGYGREYRERLNGQWGVVDVEDTIVAITGLADAGIADPNRLAIRGGSAGGWTVLAALVQSDVFACGVSYYGVADLTALAEDTHDFEARYLDGLVGGLPEAADVYRARAPINHVDQLDCPVLLLQGLDDPVVPPSQSEAFRDALVGKGIPHAYVGYEGESHGFRKAETIIHSTQAELSFYGQVMGFETPDVPQLELWRP
ncbi:prolyl oligopeptidase family serine peptidase [Cryobacterium sp. BB736]|uniref:prolyl oligopeptidase family serine peptidase n=1 Tax=Cryobacterium sp. BB736 TaxID=2746963 RepID=UPI001874F103|nr:prolyl oligopeptidase family serine peptidase [Cryobacterium sp. BB736]